MLHLLFMCVYLYVHRESAGQLINTSHCNGHFTTYSGVRVLFFPSRWVCLLCITAGCAPDRSCYSLADRHCFQYTTQLELFSSPTFVKELDMVFRHTSFYCASLIAFHRFLFVVLQIEGKTLHRQKRLQLILLRYLIAVVWNQICNKYPWGMPVKCFSLQEMQSLN